MPGRSSGRDVPAGPRYGIDSTRLSGSTGPSRPDTATVPTLEVTARDATIVVTDEGGHRTNSVLIPEDAALEEIPDSYGYTDGGQESATAAQGTVGVPARPGTRYRVELLSANGGRDSAQVVMAVGGGPVMRRSEVPFEVAANGAVRFEVIVGAADYRVSEAVAVRHAP